MRVERSVSSTQFLEVEDMKKLVNLWLQRETGSEEIDEIVNQGGIDWITRGLKTDNRNGINAYTIEERERHFGSNRKIVVKAKTFWDFAWEALEDFILRILILAGIASIIINMVNSEDDRSISWIEGFAILMAVFIVVVVTAANNLKKENEFVKLNEEAESGKKVSVVRDGQEIEDLGFEDIQVGDLINIKTGMELPGDGLVIFGFSLQIDESSMTGETKAMVKDSVENCLKKKLELQKTKGIEQLGHHDVPSPIILAGTKVMAGTGAMFIINVGRNSAIGKIKEIVASGESELTPLQLKLEKIARDIGYFGLISAVIIFVVLCLRYIIENSVNHTWGTISGGSHANTFLQYFLIAITILVVAIPEGLPLAVTLSLAYSVKKMMLDKNLVRRLQACEIMGGANIICSDKTGTLTRNEMYWTHFWNGKERVIFDAQTNQPIPFEEFTTPNSKEILLNTIILNSTEDPTKKDGNPTELAIVRFLALSGVDVMNYRTSGEVLFQAPFSSDRKRMSSVIRVGGREFIFIKGASEYILGISSSMLSLQDGTLLPLNPQIQTDVEAAIEGMARKALRTIGLAYKEVHGPLDIETKDDRGIFEFETSGFNLVGICGIKDIIRAEVPESVRKCHIAGIDVKMVTGDNKITARAIAREVNIIGEHNEKTAIVMEGPEFLRKIEGIVCDNCREREVCDCVNNEAELDKPENKGKKIRKDTIKNQEEFDKIWKNLAVLARSRPEDKYALVIGLRERDNVVAVTGDGTNDAPALSKADVGFAMGIAGTEVAKQAASIMIMDDNFASIVQAVKWGRNIYDAIRKFLMFQLTVNIVAVLVTFISSVVLEEPILSSVQMLWVNLIMDTLAALALATEPPSEKLLLRKPYKKTEYIISPIMMKMIIGHSLFQIAILLTLVFAGQYFLFDVIGQRQLQPGKKTIVNGFTHYGYRNEDYDGRYSVHAAYNFNIFVMMQLFNFFNARILDNHFNVFKNITKSTLFVIIWIAIFLLQIIFLTLTGPAIRVVMWGLDPVSWVFCIAVGALELPFGVLLKLIPLERILPGGGSKEISVAELNRATSLSVRRSHNAGFYQRQSVIERKTSIIHDQNI